MKTRFENSFKFPDLDMAITPSIGRPTPVIMNPSPDLIKLLPLIVPRNGGNMTLPAPKNIENSAKEIINKSLFFLPCIIITPFELKLTKRIPKFTNFVKKKRRFFKKILFSVNKKDSGYQLNLFFKI